MKLQVSGDSVKLSSGEYIILDKITKQVKYFATKTDLSDPGSDNELFEYLYNMAGYLVTKRTYVNGASTPSYETVYGYDNNNLLVKCTMYTAVGREKILESTLSYDMTEAKKNWIYLFPDFFEGYRYMEAFNFGKKGNYPLSAINTDIYDITDGSLIDNWNTTFDGYVFSKDGYILQTTTHGDLQQGLGLLYGITRFSYQCTK